MDSSIVSDPDTPLVLFIIFCFFTLVTLIAVKTYTDKPPSVLTMVSQSTCSILSCFMLMTIGLISIHAEWAMMIVFSMFLLFFATGLLSPEIFFFPLNS